MGKLSRKLQHILTNLRTKYKFSLRNPHNDKEVWYIYLTMINVITGIIALLLVLIIIITTTIALTPIIDYIPGYAGNRSRSVLIENNMKLDSMERQLNMWSNYYDNLVRIMDGKAPLTIGQNASDTTSSAVAKVVKVPEDSVLRAQMEGEGVYKLAGSASGKGNKNYNEMYPPLKGVVKDKFNPKVGIFGVNVVSSENQPIMAIMDGTVIQSSWTPIEGNAIYIVHPGNIISAYIHTSNLLKKVGDRVSAGEVIAFTGGSTTGDKDRGYVEFQLWYNGSPVDPENYILF